MGPSRVVLAWFLLRTDTDPLVNSVPSLFANLSHQRKIVVGPSTSKVVCGDFIGITIASLRTSAIASCVCLR